MITGSSSGLGAALWPRVEHRFAATVLGVDRRAQADDPDRLCADLATADGLERAVDAVERWGPTVLVNAAGIVQSEDLTSSPPALIDEILSVNLRAPLELMRAMSRRARPDDPVWVVNIVSPYRLVGIRDQSLYCATKAALSRAGEALAVERNGEVRVVSVAPGAFNSGIRPVQPDDAWLVRTYRNHLARTPAAVADDLVRKLAEGSRRPHRTIRLGWDGWLFEQLASTLMSDAFVSTLDRLIGRRTPPPPA